MTELTADAARTLGAVLDALIPARQDGSVAAPSELGMIEYVVDKFGDAASMLEQGMAGVNEFAAGRNAPLDTALLRDYDAEVPGLLSGIVFQLYQGYYQHPSVHEALGLEARPPYPKGYELEDGDLSLLDSVRNRGPLYREA